MRHRRKRTVTIGNEVIGDEHPAFIVAEAGVNHNGDMDIARELIVQAHEAGANAVKFQAFSAALLCDLDLTETKDVEAITGGSQSPYHMYKNLELSNDELAELYAFARAEGILFFVSVFDEARIDFLDSINISCFKISSGDLTHIPLLRYAARKRRPLIISTGMATLSEVKKAVHAIEEERVQDIIILHCTADYPPRDEEINLSAIETLRTTFSYPVGFSDHSMGVAIALAARASGAMVIEKHFTLDHNLDGPDHKMSLDVREFKQLVSGVRRIELARGSGIKKPTQAEQKLLLTSRRGMKAVRDMMKGHALALHDIKIVKPTTGIQPEHLIDVIGKRLTISVQKNHPIEWHMIER